ncbi:MAG: hypothetical protein ACI8SK_001655 [Shewanella sp.]|jgi:hypothetical protein
MQLDGSSIKSGIVAVLIVVAIIGVMINSLQDIHRAE